MDGRHLHLGCEGRKPRHPRELWAVSTGSRLLSGATVGAYCAQPNGRVSIVGRLGDRMPDGGTMLAPLGISVTEAGEVYLAAQVFEGGREFVALYLASPL